MTRDIVDARDQLHEDVPYRRRTAFESANVLAEERFVRHTSRDPLERNETHLLPRHVGRETTFAQDAQ